VAYETFLGGTGTDSSIGIGVDNGGRAYIVGNTSSTDFPTSNTNVLGYQTGSATKGSQCAAPITCKSVFAAVLNASGSAPLIYSSYFSGNGDDEASGMTIDLNGGVFITGTTTSNNAPAISPTPVDFPATYLPVPFQTQPLSSIQFFVTKVNTSLGGASGVAYSTYFGGSTPSSPIATGGGIAVDSTGNIYFSGTTNFFNSGFGSFGDSQSSDFPILNAYQPCLNTPPPNVLPCPTMGSTSPSDAYVARLSNPTLSTTGTPNNVALTYFSYLGGGGNDSGLGIAVLNTSSATLGDVVVTGATNSI